MVIATSDTQCGYINLPSGVWAISATLTFRWTAGSQNYVFGALTQGSTFSTATPIAISVTPKMATPVVATTSGSFNLTSFVSSVAGTTVWLEASCSNLSGGTCRLGVAASPPLTTFIRAIRIA